MCGETSATESDDTSRGNLIDDGFGFEGALVYEGGGTIDLREPFITFHIDEDSLSGGTPSVGPVAYSGDGTAYRRTDVRADESTCFSEQFAYFHFRSDSHHSLGRCTDMLHKRDDSLLGQWALRDRLMCGELFVVMRMNSAYFECSHKFLFFFVTT